MHIITKLASFSTVALLAFTSHAHHSRSDFDTSWSVSVTGKVTEFSWSNPHIFIEFESEETGDIWLVEAGSVTTMRRRGWTKDMLKPGDLVTFEGQPHRDASKNFMLMRELTIGDQIVSSRGQRGDEGPVEPSTDFSGIWHMDMRGFDIAAAGGPPPSDWPYNEAGQKLANAYDPEDSPELDCKQIGVPRIMIYPYNIEFTRTEKSLNVFKEHLNERRTIWFDASDAKAANEPASPTGTSIGTFISDKELHIRTDNFTPTEWGVENALDSSAQKTVQEIYRLSDDGLRIDMEFTIEDPALFKSPLVREVSFIKQGNIDIVEIACDPRAADRHVTLDRSQTARAGTSQPPGNTAANPLVNKPWWRFWN